MLTSAYNAIYYNQARGVTAFACYRDTPEILSDQKILPAQEALQMGLAFHGNTHNWVETSLSDASGFPLIYSDFSVILI